MQIDNFSSSSSGRPCHTRKRSLEEGSGTTGARIRMPRITWARVVLLIVLAFLLMGGFQGQPADAETSGRVRVSARVLSVGTLAQTTTQLEREWADKIEESTLQSDLATLEEARSLQLTSKEFEAFLDRWTGERDVGNGVVRFQFASPDTSGGDPLLSIEWISN